MPPVCQCTLPRRDICRVVYKVGGAACINRQYRHEPIRQRAINNENDENIGSTRVTRAKAAALTIPNDAGGENMVEKALGTKKSATNASISNTAGGQRKRAALGDVSNVTKTELVDSKEGKKVLGGKAGLVSKAAQNAGVQKLSRANSSRSILSAKDQNKKTTSSDLKRPASGSGVMGGALKKRHTGSTGSQQSIKEENADSENEPPHKAAASTGVERVKTETKQEVPNTCLSSSRGGGQTSFC